jgi:hypothetical protein
MNESAARRGRGGSTTTEKASEGEREKENTGKKQGRDTSLSHGRDAQRGEGETCKTHQTRARQVQLVYKKSSLAEELSQKNMVVTMVW